MLWEYSLRASEFLRKLSDLIVCIEKSQDESPEIKGAEDAQAPFVPPLQQNIELLKKAAGVESIYSEKDESIDEIERMKHNAGLASIIVGSNTFPD